MVHLVVIQGPGQQNLEGHLRKASNGFFVLSAGYYVVVMDTTAISIINWLQALGASRVDVFPLRKQWATLGHNELAQWLHGADPFF